jgi:6-phosphofructokinase 1
VVIVVCEGQLDDKGRAFGADVDRAESTVHRLASNLGHTLAMSLGQRTNLRARAEKPGLMGRSCAALASEIDRKEAFACGRAAVRAALNGEAEKMVTLVRTSQEPYAFETGVTELEKVARVERPLPKEWINADGNDVCAGIRDYLMPLVGKLEFFPRQV